MYSNEKHFTKDPFEDNGRFQIHPLSEEGLEAYLSKDSYNYHFLKSKQDPELLKQIQQEYEEEQAKQKTCEEQEKKENESQKDKPECCGNSQSDNKEVKNTNCNCNKNCKKTTGKKSPGKKSNNTCKAKNNFSKKEDVKISNNTTKKNENQDNKKITGKNLAQKIKGQGSSMPVIVNVNADYHSLKNYPKPKQF